MQAFGLWGAIFRTVKRRFFASFSICGDTVEEGEQQIGLLERDWLDECFLVWLLRREEV